MKFINKLTSAKACVFLFLISVFFFSCSTEFDSQLDELLSTLYCPCGCVRETNKACVCETAQMMESMFRKRLSEGETVEEIRTDYLNTYGTQFSAVMKAEGINLLAYIMPAVILITIGGVIFVIRHQSRGNKVPAKETDKEISDELQQHLEDELERYKQQK